jgi:hypothetical protein
MGLAMFKSNGFKVFLVLLPMVIGILWLSYGNLVQKMFPDPEIVEVEVIKEVVKTVVKENVVYKNPNGLPIKVLNFNENNFELRLKMDDYVKDNDIIKVQLIGILNDDEGQWVMLRVEIKGVVYSRSYNMVSGDVVTWDR